MGGFRQSTHKGSTLTKLVFYNCNFDLDEDDEPILDDDGQASGASLALIAGLGDGLFPNLQELSASHSPLLVGKVAELVEVLRGGAPCARTLRTIVISGKFGVVAIEALQAVLPQATVILETLSR
jgi:hypothetical protein